MSTTDPVVPQTAPLAPERVASLNSLLKGLQADQLLWVEGFISGLRATFGATSHTADAEKMEKIIQDTSEEVTELKAAADAKLQGMFKQKEEAPAELE